MKIKLILGAAFLLIFQSAITKADVIEISFTGFLSDFAGIAAVDIELSAYFSAGDTFSGNYAYDTESLSTIDVTPNSAFHSGASLTVSLNSYDYSSAAHFEILNDYTSGEDYFSFRSGIPSAPVVDMGTDSNGLNLREVQSAFLDSSGSALSSTDVLLTAPTISDFDYAYIQFNFTGSGSDPFYHMQGLIDSIAVTSITESPAITPCETSTITCLHIPEVSNLDADDVESYIGTDSQLTLLYKSEFDDDEPNGAGDEFGLFKDNYSTEYVTDADDEPTGADIFHDLGDIINCAECYLVVKDGRQGDPSQYLFDISDSGDLMTLALNGFWDGDGVKGSISNIAIYGATQSPVPVPAAFWLFGTALIGFVGFSKRRNAA